MVDVDIVFENNLSATAEQGCILPREKEIGVLLAQRPGHQIM